MIALVLTAAFVLAAVATLIVLADCSLRWVSAFTTLRARAKRGYAIDLVPARSPLDRGTVNGFDRSAKVYPVIRQTVRQAA